MPRGPIAIHRGFGGGRGGGGGGQPHKEFPALTAQPKVEISFPQKESQIVMMIDRKNKPLGLPQGPPTFKLRGESLYLEHEGGVLKCL